MKKLLNIVKIGALCLVLVLLGYCNDIVKNNDVNYGVKVITKHDIGRDQIKNFDDKNFEYMSVCLDFVDKQDLWDMSLKLDEKTNVSKWWKEDDVEYELYWNDDNAWLCRYDYENDKYCVFNYTRPESYNNKEKSI